MQKSIHVYFFRRGTYYEDKLADMKRDGEPHLYNERVGQYLSVTDLNQVLDANADSTRIDIVLVTERGEIVDRGVAINHLS